MEKVKTALIGCGKVGHTHAGAFSKLDESAFVAVCDSDRSRAELAPTGRFWSKSAPELKPVAV